MDDPERLKAREALLKKIMGSGSTLPIVPPKAPANLRVRQQFAKIFQDEASRAGFDAFMEEINTMTAQRRTDLQHTEWKELAKMMVPTSGGSDFQGYRCPTAACLFKSSTEADMRTHCLKDCEEKGAYIRMFDQDRALEEESIPPTRDFGGPIRRARMSRPTKRDGLVRNIVESVMDSTVHSSEIDPARYPDVRSELTQYVETRLATEMPTRRSLKRLCSDPPVPFKSFNELKTEIENQDAECESEL